MPSPHTIVGLALRPLTVVLLAAGVLVLSGLRTAVPALATPPTIGVIGCANSENPSTIQFPTQPGVFGGNIISAGAQNPIAGIAPATLNAKDASSVALCSGLFQDSDVDPNLIDGGVLHYHVSDGAIIGESGTTDYFVSCGAADLFIETCQGANTQLVPPFTVVATPNAGNSIHVQLAPHHGIGQLPSTVAVSATYSRFGSYGPPFVLSTNAIVIPVTTK